MANYLETVLKLFNDSVRMAKRGFFTTFFKTTPEDYTDGEFVNIDIVRSGNKVSPVLRDRRTGAVVVDADVFTEKKFRPPIMALKNPLDLWELMERQPGERIDAKVGSWFGRLFNKIKTVLLKFHMMFKENIELQCSQIMQTGVVTLHDEDGNAVYDLDFKLKSTHFPTATNSWDGASADPIGDLESLCTVITEDGKTDPSIVLFGSNAWRNALKNEAFKESVKKDGLNLGALNPAMANRGGRYMGFIDIGSFRLELWVYNASYELLGSEGVVKYLHPDKVVVTAAIEDLDFRIVFGGVPSLGMVEPFVGVVPSVVTYDGSIRAYNRVYADQAGDTFTAESKCRALAIPVSGDMFGTLTTAIGGE